MPTWMKVLLILGVLLVFLIIGSVVAFFFLARTYGPGLVQAGKQTFEEGAAYGKSTDEQGCLDEAVARHQRAEGLADAIKLSVFMRACLESSKTTPGFCESVPGRMEFMKSIAWQQQQCRHYGLSPERQCGQLFQQVQQFCEMRRQRGENANEGDRDLGDPVAPPPPPPAAQPARTR